MTSSQNIPKFFPSNSRALSFIDEVAQGDSAKSISRIVTHPRCPPDLESGN